MTFASSKRKHKVENGHVSPPLTKRRLQSTTTTSSVASFFTPTSQKPPEKITWNIVRNTLISCHYSPTAELQSERRKSKRRKIAAFDLDSTLTKTKSGNIFPKDASDWQWWDPCIPGNLKRLDHEGHQVIIFSNQKGISLTKDSKTINSDKKRLNDFKGRIGAIAAQLEIPMSVYAATERDQYRKPRTGMWSEMLEYYDLEGEDGIDVGGSFFVGDAGGREGDGSSGGSDKDFSSSDRDFAANVGIPFHTPEEYFLGASRRTFIRTFDPSVYLVEDRKASTIARVNEQDIIIFVGSPGSGKSTFYWNNLAMLGYERINQDTLKTREKCLKVSAEVLTNGKSVAVDNTNADRDIRKFWIDLAKRFNIPIRCVVFRADTKLCEHNEAVRALGGPSMNPEARAALPKIAILGFANRFQEPTLDEGFQDITIVEFSFRGTPEQRAIWSQYHI